MEQRLQRAADFSAASRSNSAEQSVDVNEPRDVGKTDSRVAQAGLETA